MKGIETLTKNKDFQRVYLRGKSFVSPVLVTYVLKNNKGLNRFGITTSKKIGKAVKRNRARRIIKEAFFQMNLKGSGFDLVFVARGKTSQLKTPDILKAMEDHFKKAKIFNALN